MKLKLGLIGASLILGATAASAHGQASLQRDTGVAVPMRDGVVLRADLYRPSGAGKFPVLVYRTPYDRSDTAGAPPFARTAVARGYAVLLQDVRGRYGSGGTFVAYQQEGKDGYDTIEWAARQPWSNGAVGTFGLSYPGAVQWLAALERPPSLKAMVPAMTYSRPENFWYQGGVWDGSWLDWTWLNIAPDLRRRRGVSGPKTDEEAARSWDRDGAAARRFRPLLDLPDFKDVAPWYYEWMRHPPGDAWWNWTRLEGRYDGVKAAVLNLSGWFDEPYGASGAVENFQGSGDALILGPWTHGVASVQRSKAGDREFGSSAAINYSETVLDWMDRHLKAGASKSPARKVRVFVMGTNQWREADGWPFPGTRSETFYMAGKGGSREVGKLERNPPGSEADALVIQSNPAQPVTDPFEGRFGAHDYRALKQGPSVAVFESEPFQSPLEIIGRVSVELFASATVPDFDLWVQLFDVAPDGSAWNLSSAGTLLQRASYRDGGPKRQVVKSGEPVRLQMDRMITANRFLTGHRLRVVITPQFYPFFSVNPQTGLQEFESDSVRAGEIRIAPRSRIVLPVVSR
jgi:putative CocE/NonD family hydrolase